ncbi:MAG: hypothetical protein PHE33_11525 [Bacteroidales bacterium]|nr:hypothetical protein [Bacteroidales bacterium]
MKYKDISASFDAYQLHKANRMNNAGYVNFYTYSNSSTEHYVEFTEISTTSIRFYNIGGSSNPNFREIEVYSNLSGCPSITRTPVTVNVDNTSPTYGGYANVSGYQYYDGTSYWVKGGNVLTVDITHSDNVSVWRQYFGFNHNNCTPNNCGGAPDEIKSYTTMGSFADWLANDSYLNITNASVVGGAWGSTTITNRWSTTFASSCPDWDWYMYTYLYDWCSKGVGYTALGKWVKVDNTAPTHDEVTVNNSCWATDGSNTYTITIKSTEPRSGFGGSYGMMALVNYNLGEPLAGGYFAWHPTSYVYSDDQMACSGGGYVSKASTWGGARIDLVSATTSVSGSQRTVTFTVRPHSDYLERDGDNKISMYTSDNCSNNAGWTLFDVNFTTTRVPSAPTGATTICVGGSATLTRGNTPPTGVTYYWQTSPSGTSTSIGSGATLVVSPGSTTTYYLRPYSSSGCWGQASSGVTVSVVKLPTTANAGPDQTGASTCGLTTVTLAGNDPEIGTGSWSIVSGTGGGFANSSQHNTTFTGTAGSTYTLRWTISNSPCNSSSDDVVITFNQSPTPADAGTDQYICGTSTSLEANTPTIGIGTWSIVTGENGTISNTSNPSSTFTGVVGNVYTLKWTISNSICPDSEDYILISLNNNPSVSVTGASTICSGLTATLRAFGENPVGIMSYQWQYYNGDSWVDIGTNNHTLITQALTSTTNFRCLYNSTGIGCSSAISNEVTITVNTPNSSELVSDDYVWTGAISNDWNNPSNWIVFNGTDFYIPTVVPSTSNDVLFTTYGSNCGSSTPVISSAFGSCRNFDNESGHTVEMSNGQTLTVAGNWNNMGTFNAGNGKVLFSSNSQQHVNTNSSSFYNIEFNNNSISDASIIINDELFINGNAVFANGVVVFSGGGSLTFGSSG